MAETQIPTTFRTRDLDFGSRNRRTRAAFEHGVKARALSAPFIYRFCDSDYQEAERAGYEQAAVRFSRGEFWICENCGAKHGS